MSRTVIIQVRVSERALKGLAWSPEPREERLNAHLPLQNCLFPEVCLDF